MLEGKAPLQFRNSPCHHCTPFPTIRASAGQSCVLVQPDNVLANPLELFHQHWMGGQQLIGLLATAFGRPAARWHTP
ncbi:hypothetical protein [Zobellella taiwanensis]